MTRSEVQTKARAQRAWIEPSPVELHGRADVRVQVRRDPLRRDEANHPDEAAIRRHCGIAQVESELQLDAAGRPLDRYVDDHVFDGPADLPGDAERGMQAGVPEVVGDILGTQLELGESEVDALERRDGVRIEHHRTTEALQPGRSEPERAERQPDAPAVEHDLRIAERGADRRVQVDRRRRVGRCLGQPERQRSRPRDRQAPGHVQVGHDGETSVPVATVAK